MQSDAEKIRTWLKEIDKCTLMMMDKELIKMLTKAVETLEDVASEGKPTKEISDGINHEYSIDDARDCLKEMAEGL